MVCRLHDVLGILRCRHGPYELRLSSSLNPEASIHCGLLWLHHLDACLCYQGWLSRILRSRQGNKMDVWLTTQIASQYYPHVACCLGPDCLLDLVSCQLLPHGLDRSTFCHHLRRKTGGFLDELSKGASGADLDSLWRPYAPWTTITTLYTKKRLYSILSTSSSAPVFCCGVTGSGGISHLRERFLHLVGSMGSQYDPRLAHHPSNRIGFNESGQVVSRLCAQQYCIIRVFL